MKKRAIITGASRGIGKAIAERLAMEGYSLLINCRSSFGLLDELTDRLSKITECTAVHGEIGASELEDFLGNKESCALGEIFLINNAGISGIKLFQDVSEQELTDMLEANLLSMLRLSRTLIPYLLKSTNGRILNISSVWGVCGASMETVYSMTKGGINSFTKALGKELAPSHVPVNALALGAVDTDMNAWLSTEERRSLEEEIPYGRMARGEEVAELAVNILKSPSYLTAQVIGFDGGWI